MFPLYLALAVQLKTILTKDSTRISKENAMTTWARIKYQGEGTHSYTGTVTHVCLYLNTNNAQTWNVVPFTILCNGTGHR